ncbi:aa3-type cytochrome c oxidase subunit IV [Pelagibacterium sp. 26DY04]|uniref:aa3-type cytochrome c oxidase subunit IV n=1 Tax=unclassified Pelagibacterium TaxID=2623280 RepID=UPI002814ECBB|nr:MULTISPECIES: aa3-type cytochrome c oxidase subunit IV [unclassified Pelagibacterium]WMT86341.1 aa3-type cytochrome c oxidase subunit IV [Pelagibacterium sp. 26DY04]WMT89414.1 aa3-type cytochrome c oxidase subunit IV [Pelagibacterium sp. H642]
MAENQVATFSNEPISDAEKAKEFEEHTKTYAGFLAGTKWTVIATVAILVVLYLVFVV